jgi:osmotically-inducible protein OsmY
MHTDEDIRREIERKLRSEPNLDAREIGVTVRDRIVTSVVKDGWVNLQGAVTWGFEREIAGAAVYRLRGAKGVLNQLQVKSGLAIASRSRQVRREP